MKKPIKILIYAITGLVVLAALVYFVFMPMSTDIAILWGENSLKSAMVKEMGNRVKGLEQIQSQEEEISSLLNQVDSFLPDKEEAGGFLVQVEALAATSNNNLIDIDFKEDKSTNSNASQTSTDNGTQNAPSQVKGASVSNPRIAGTTSTGKTSSVSLKSIDYKATIEGSFPTIYDFLQKLENMNRFNLLEKADMNCSTDDVVKLFVKGKIYYQQ